MVEIAAYFQTASGDPLVGPTGVDIPEVIVVRTPGNTIEQAFIDMTEMINASGWYTFTFPTVDGEEYVWIADGDPAVSGQVPATARFDRGVISGTTVERSEVDVPAILVDTQDIQSRLPTLLVGGRMDSDVGNMQADVVDAAAIATDAVAEIADAVWDELAIAHSVAGSFGEEVKVKLTTIQATQLLELFRILGLDPTTPLIVSKTSRTAGGTISQTVEENVPVAGSVKITRT